MSSLIINPYRFVTAAPPANPGANAMQWDGTNDWALRGGQLTGLTDGDEFLLSGWFKHDGTTTSNQRIFGNRNGSAIGFGINRANDDRYDTYHYSGSTYLWNGKGNNTQIFNTDPWHHILISGKSTSGSVDYKFYLDDVDDTATGTMGVGTFDFVNVSAEWSFCARIDTNIPYAGSVSEFYWTNEYLDLSVTANRRKFITSGGLPEDLGADGSTPTGTQPFIYFPDGDPSNNKGKGGNFSITGAPSSVSGPNP